MRDSGRSTSHGRRPSTGGYCSYFLPIGLSLLVLLFVDRAEPLAIPGTGEGSVADVYNSLGAAYLYAKDVVSVAYTATTTVNTSLSALPGGRVNFVGTSSSMATYYTSAAAATYAQIPVMATAMVPAYTTSVFPALVSGSVLTLTGPVVAGMWDGTYTAWNDTGVAAVNANVNLTTGTDNTLKIIYCNDVLGEGGVLANYLSALSPAIKAVFDQYKTSGFANLAAVTGGRAFSACSNAAKLALLATHPKSVVFFMYPDYKKNSTGLSIAKMADKTGTVVSLTVSTLAQVTTAMTASTLNNNGTLVYDMTNQANGAWPLSTVSSVVVYNDDGVTSANSIDCATIKEVLSFLSWTQINDNAGTLIKSSGFLPLTGRQRKNMLDALSRVICNGQSALTAAFLLGMGPIIPTYTSWATEFGSSGFILKYFSTSSVEGLASLVDNSIDFASTGALLTPTQQAALPDVLTVPVVSYGFVWNYNLPELINTDYRVVLSFQVVSDIYFDRIQKWDHPDILALNPTIASLLPVNKSIIVTYFTTVQVTAQAINQALCANVPEFNSTVGWTGVPVYPISQSSPGRTQPCATLNEATVAMRTPYALGMGVSFTALTSAYLRPASLLINGTVLAPTRDSIVQGITNSASPTDLFILAPPGNAGSWPMISTNALAVHSRNMVDCTKAKKLVEFIYWTQTDETAATIAKANKMIVAGQSAPVRRAMLNFIANVTCAGELVTDIAYCILNGTICSDNGACFGRTCVCESGWQGTHCETPVPVATNSGSTDVLVPLLAACLPFLGVLLLLGLILGLFLYWRVRHLQMRDEWEIPYSEVDLGEPLGQGGFGSVFRSEWRGTQVAVKVLTDGRINKEIERNFREEVAIMSNLRHPNVVLFMGACTKPPRMFIIMEYMALGSLYELLHNELVPEIPALLRIKLLYQAAKGMHFLHSSGVAHCDLKSLNLLLDNKWNLKVSDFGLTKVKSELMKNGPKGGAVGTIHWTAPEILAESENIDYVLADTYSYGIVMWEAFTRQQPYEGMSPAAIAVAVLRNNYRPPLPEGYDLSSLPSGILDDSFSTCSTRGQPAGSISGASSRMMHSPAFDSDLKYLHLMVQCWHQDPVMRPSFLEIMTQLSTNDYTGGSKSGGSSSSSSSASMSFADIRHAQSGRHHPDDTSALASNTSDGMSSSASLGSGSIDGSASNIPMFKYKVKLDAAGNLVGRYGANEALLSSDNVAVAFLDVTSAHVLWQRAPEEMVETMTIFNKLVRDLAARHHGYETTVGDRGNSEGSMCLLFTEPEAASVMCFELQKELLAAPWPPKLLSVPQAEEVVDPISGDVVFRGLRVRCGIHVGSISAKRSKDARKAGIKHSGPAIDAAMKLASVAKPGQIVISAIVRNRLAELGLIQKGKGNDDDGDDDNNTNKNNTKRRKDKKIKTSFLKKVELPVSRVRTSSSYPATQSDGERDVEPSNSSTTAARRERTESGDAQEIKAYEMRVPGLLRYFERDHDDERSSDEDGSSSTLMEPVRGRGREGLDGDAETWLNSANMCPWIIDYSKVTVYEDKPLGSGSYGVVYRGRWQNVEVAVKRFIKQTMNERSTLEFRSEMSILSNMQHPNIITFIGACVVEPNMCIITEYMKNGSLRAILSSSLKLSFNDRMRMLFHTAQGLQYLHDTVSPSIIHRDLKCSNILVDEADGIWTVKIADFGLARVKEANTTMTRCGTPSWIAPEIIRGEKYTEKADIYSLGIIMWEVLTRRVPYEGLNFMGVSLQVLDNQRPEIPDNCPLEFRKIMTRCWHPKAHKRPAIGEVVGFFKQLVGVSPFDV